MVFPDKRLDQSEGDVETIRNNTERRRKQKIKRSSPIVKLRNERGRIERGERISSLHLMKGFL